MPPWLISEPASRKNGIAINENESQDVNSLFGIISSPVPVRYMTNADERIRAKPIGTFSINRMRSVPNRRRAIVP